MTDDEFEKRRDQVRNLLMIIADLRNGELWEMKKDAKSMYNYICDCRQYAQSVLHVFFNVPKNKWAYGSEEWDEAASKALAAEEELK